MGVAQAYADYYDVMALTEELVSGLVKSVTGSFQIQYHSSEQLSFLTLHTVALMFLCRVIFYLRSSHRLWLPTLLLVYFTFTCSCLTKCCSLHRSA